MTKICSILGHRKVELSDEMYDYLVSVIENLITKSKVTIFNFGSKSEFNDICHNIITKLKQTKYPNIIRRKYTCQSEACILENDRERLEKIASRVSGKEIKLLGFEEEVEHKNKYTAGRASYVERNQAMIDDSDICLFFYDKNYEPQLALHSKKFCRSNIGTAISYNYAQKKKKQIINIFEFNKN